jgi:hypothetical protein
MPSLVVSLGCNQYVKPFRLDLGDNAASYLALEAHFDSSALGNVKILLRQTLTRLVPSNEYEAEVDSIELFIDENRNTIVLQSRKQRIQFYLYLSQVTLEAMARSEVKKLMEQLRTWVDAEYGRRADVARELGVPRQRITDWLSGRKAPTLEQGLRLASILRRSKSARPGDRRKPCNE